MFKFLISLMGLIFSVLELSGCAALAVSGAGGARKIACDERSAGTMLDDQSLELQAIKTLHSHPDLWKNNHIIPVVYNKNLLLIGQVQSDYLKNKARSVLQTAFPQIRQVYNELSIDSPSEILRRSNDSWITTQIKTQLIANKAIHAGRIKVITENAVVYLLGIIDKNEEEDILDITRRVNGVEKVLPLFEFI